MLIDPVGARLLGGVQGGLFFSERHKRVAVMNGMQFGQTAAWPTGYQSVVRARVPSIKTSGQMSAQAGLRIDLLASLFATGNLAAAATIEVDLTAAGNVLGNMAASAGIEIDFTASIRSTGNMAAVFNIPGLPTANDIASEVWSGLKLEGDLSAASILRLLLAVAAGKSDIAAGSPVVVTFRDQADTKNRVRAEMTGSERTVVTLLPD
jgi:hypothetical protein